MRIHRIFTDQDLQPEQAIQLPEQTAHYLSRVLRVTVGQRVLLFNGDGFDYAADVDRVGRGELGVQIQARLPAVAESQLQLTLVQAISRGERMDLSLQKATELGVSAIQPVITVRTEVKLKAEKQKRRLEHWRRVMISACEQSGRARIPDLGEPMELWAWAQQEPGLKRIVLLQGADQTLASLTPVPGFELLVGPEGGFEDQELLMLKQQGIESASMGPRVLRTETAGPAAIAILQAMAGDLV